MIPLPNLSASSSAMSKLIEQGNQWALGGAWNINVGGSGTTTQTGAASTQPAALPGTVAAAASSIPWVYVALALGVAWYLKK
jgi:hypothetical protein